jgi:hypothetical protein
VKWIPGGPTLAALQLGIALVMSATATAGGTSGALFVGGCAVVASFAIVRWPTGACAPAIVLVAVALGYGSDNRMIALFEALACGLLAVVLVLLGGIRVGNQRMWRTRWNVITGAVLAALISVGGALVDSNWGWLAVLMPLCLGVVYVTVMLVLRRPISSTAEDDLLRVGTGSLHDAAYTSLRSFNER